MSYGDATFEVPEDDASTSLDARDAPDLRPRAAAAAPSAPSAAFAAPRPSTAKGRPRDPRPTPSESEPGVPGGASSPAAEKTAGRIAARPSSAKGRPRDARDRGRGVPIPPATDRIRGGERRASDETDPAGFGLAAAAAAAPWAGAFDDDGADADSRSPEQAANAFPERRTTTTSRSDDETDPGAAPWPGALDADSDEESRERPERDDSVPAVDRPIGGPRPDAFASRREATSPPPAAASVVSADADAFGGDARRLPSSPSASSPAAAEAEDATEALHRRLAANDPLAMLKARAAKIATEDAAKEEDDVAEAEAEASAASATEPSASATEPSAPESESARLARADARWSGGGSAAFPWTRAAEDSRAEDSRAKKKQSAARDGDPAAPVVVVSREALEAADRRWGGLGGSGAFPPGPRSDTSAEEVATEGAPTPAGKARRGPGGLESEEEEIDDVAWEMSPRMRLATGGGIRGGLGRGSSGGAPARREILGGSSFDGASDETSRATGAAGTLVEDVDANPRGRLRSGPERVESVRDEPAADEEERDLLASLRAFRRGEVPRGDASRLLERLLSAAAAERRDEEDAAVRTSRGVEGDGGSYEPTRALSGAPASRPTPEASALAAAQFAAARPSRGAVAFDPLDPLASVAALNDPPASSVARGIDPGAWSAYLSGASPYPGSGSGSATDADARGLGPATLRAAAKEGRVAGDAFDRRLRDALEGAPPTPPHAAWAAALQMRAFDGAARARVAALRTRLRAAVRRTEVGRGREGVPVPGMMPSFARGGIGVEAA